RGGAVVGHGPDADPPAAYPRSDARQAVAQCVAVPYGLPVAVADGVELRLADAGHILGSAMVSLAFSWGGRDRRITFTGDVGRPGMPLLRPPDAVPEADLVISESTYGGRRPDPMGQTAEALAHVGRRTAEGGGRGR